MNLEDQLRGALKREDPPAGFAERLIQQAGPARLRPAKPKRRWNMVWPSLAAAAAVAVMSVGPVLHRRWERVPQEELAARQAAQALQMVAEELNLAQNEVLNK